MLKNGEDVALSALRLQTSR